jgi:hypothetical protein
MAARKGVRAQGYLGMRESFYRLRSKDRGGGEAGSKTKEFAEENKVGVGEPTRSGAKTIEGLGSTKTIAPVTAGSTGWQHAAVQSIAAFRP